MDRRDFLRGGMGAAILAARPADSFAQNRTPTPDQSWDAGQLRHLLPAVSDTRILIKASFAKPLTGAPTLHVGASTFRGSMNDTEGAFWQFDAGGLQPGRRHSLSLTGADAKSLCESWDLSTFPARTSRPDSFRVLFFTCAGGPDGANQSSTDKLTIGNLPTAIRNRLMRRALAFQPQAMVANGDHVYWDLHSPRVPPERRDYTRLKSFNRSALIFGNTNETVLKVAAGPQITPVYGTDFRSTPVFFLQDDHDYFDNDEAFDEIITFPPVWFQLQLARATQKLYYPEFLPDEDRPRGLPWGSVGDAAVSESWGTIRYGRLAEVLLYDVRRMCTLDGPTATYVDPEVERWLLARSSSPEVTHVVQAPSNPMGWSAGKWMEWYPDVLNSDGKLTTSVPKPYWQSGWMKQHDRLVAAMTGMKGRIPLTVSGDLHAVGIGKILRSGSLNLEKNPLTTVLAGPIGTAPGGWPSAFRGVGPSTPEHLDLREEIKPIEQHGFTIADFLPDRIRLRFFKWDLKTQAPDAIDNLQPFHTTELGRPV
ncbi:MAG: alkaline phosphatase D family protein [Bryobacteraceae bacterium]